MRLLAAVCSKGTPVASMNEAIFRLIHEEHPTLCIDEAEGLEGRTDRAEALREILREGYKRGARVPRCVGEDHRIEFFDVYCPKIFACIQGLTGALLDRCVVIHMERAPRGSKRKSSRVRALRRDSTPLIEQLEAYAVQFRVALQALYDAEPDEGYFPEVVEQREAELWGPLAIHARLIGPEAEKRLLTVARDFGQAKAEIEAHDKNTAKTCALLEALEKLSGDTFSPADLVDELSKSDAWAYTFSKVKGADDKTRDRMKASAVGSALRSFRLRAKKEKSGNMYSLAEAIKVIAGHVPEKVPPVPDVPPAEVPPQVPPAQVIDNKDAAERVEPVEPFAGSDTNTTWEPNKGSINDEGGEDNPTAGFV